MKLKKILLTIVMLVLLSVTLVGCSVAMYNVTFNSNGGSAVASKASSGFVARPTQPTKAGYEFAGWYKDEGLTEEFDFGSKIAGDITLYAKWVEQGQNNGDSGGNNQNQGGDNGQGQNQGDNGQGNNQPPTEYTVTFESNGGSEVTNIKTTSKITKPTDPTKDNNRFDGWYSDSGLTQLFNFDSSITSDITLYAKWTHIDNTDYQEGSYSQEQIDAYILAMDFTNTQISNSDQYAAFLDYAMLNRLTELELSVNGVSDVSKLIDEGWNKKKISIDVSVNFNYTNTRIITTFTYPERATTSASNTNAYEQVPFVCVTKQSNRDESFIDFKINSINNTYSVTDSDQLCYVLEHGYRPTFSSDDAPAKRMFDAACAALRTICDDTFSDIEKLHAIYDWLIENVTYDDALFDKVIDPAGDNLKKYKGFYLEGVFDDYRAVCDGISKAFMVMARIEGIECVQVTGKSIETNVGHAWNKVRLNGRWYIIDATGGGVVVGGEKEMLTHRLFMCNDAYYSTNYTASEYTNLVADSEYSIYRDLKYTYKGSTHDYYIDDIDELADILAYYNSLADKTKTIDFYYAGNDNVSDAIHSAMQKAHLSGSYSTIQNDGSIIYKFN